MCNWFAAGVYSTIRSEKGTSESVGKLADASGVCSECPVFPLVSLAGIMQKGRREWTARQALAEVGRLSLALNPPGPSNYP